MSVIVPAEAIANILEVITIGKDYLVIMTAILVWDTLGTLPAEYRYIWKAKWTPLKVFFLINRYWTIILLALVTWLIVGSVSPQLCTKIARFEPGGTIITIMSCAAILSIRIHALFQQSPRILLTLCILMALECTVLCVATSQFEAVSLPPGINGCIAAGKSGKPGFVAAFWAAPLVFDTVILGLTIYRFVLLRRRSGITGVRIPILDTFLQDGVFYYLVIFVVDTINIAFYAQPRQELQSINSGASTVLTSLMASRLVLHLHSTGATRPAFSLYDAERPRQNLGSPSFLPSKFSLIKSPGRAHSPPSQQVSRTGSEPLAGFSLQGAEEMPMQVRVALRGIGTDEVEMGLKSEREEQAERERQAKKRHQSDGPRSTSVGGGIRVERELVVSIDDGNEDEIKVGRSRSGGY